jgi:hypothetical protein
VPDAIEQIQERHEAALMAVPGVTGVGVGLRDGHPVLLVLVRERTPEVARLPQSLDGIPLVVDVVGDITAS